jgi:hypothetical protein
MWILRRLCRPVLGLALVALLAVPAAASAEMPQYPVPARAVLVKRLTFDNVVASDQAIYMSHGWSVFQAAPGRFSTGTTNPGSVQGTKRGRFEVVPGDPLVANGPRAQVSFNPPGGIPDETVTQTCGRWYIPSYSDLPGPFQSWQILYEEHPSGSSTNPLYAHTPEALWIVGTRGQPYTLRLASGTGMRTDWVSQAGAFLPDTWHSFCVRALWSPEQSGWVALWVDGQWQRLNNGQMRKYQMTMPSPGHYPMVGIYDGGGSGNQQHSVTFMDDIQIWSLG